MKTASSNEGGGMNVVDYNGEGRWSRVEILSRYMRYAASAGTGPRDLSPDEQAEGDRHWIYPVMMKVIDGIEAGDAACIQIGIEFIEEDATFPFGKILKSNTARALRRAPLSDPQKCRIRDRVFHMLRTGRTPHEYREYAKLVRRIGFTADDLPAIDLSNKYAARFLAYYKGVLDAGGSSGTFGLAGGSDVARC